MNEEPTNILLESLQSDVEQLGAAMKVVAQTIISEEISEYPVFVASQQILDIGRPLFDQDSVHLNWFFNVSVLEEFLKKEIVTTEQLANFKRTYKEPEEKACIFLVTEESAQFVFIPYTFQN